MILQSTGVDSCVPHLFDQSTGGRRVGRCLKENEGFDTAAHCDGSGANGTLACLPRVHFIPHTGGVINFQGQACVKTVGPGCSCAFGISFLPGVICGNTGILAAYLFYSLDKTQTGLLQSRLCRESPLQEKYKRVHPRRCVDLIPEGQPCNHNEYDLIGNPCVQSDHVVACIKETLAHRLRPGASWTTPENPFSWSIGQCASVPKPTGIDRPKYLKSETGSLKCWAPIYELRACSDSSRTGCIGPDAQCIKGYCGVRISGQVACAGRAEHPSQA
jgi:hypothetical protein